MDNSYKWAGGGFLSTTDDLVRYGMAHLQPGFLNAGTLEWLFKQQRLANGEPTEKGIGWSVGVDERSRRMWHHGGSSVGARANLAIYPDQGLVVAILVNLRVAPPPGRRAADIVEMFLQ